MDEVGQRTVDVADVAVVDLARCGAPSATYWKMPWSRPSGVSEARSRRVDDPEERRQRDRERREERAEDARRREWRAP